MPELSQEDQKALVAKIAKAFGVTDPVEKSLEQALDELASAAGVIMTGKIGHGHVIKPDEDRLIDAAIMVVKRQTDGTYADRDALGNGRMAKMDYTEQMEAAVRMREYKARQAAPAANEVQGNTITVESPAPKIDLKR